MSHLLFHEQRQVLKDKLLLLEKLVTEKVPSKKELI